MDELQNEYARLMTRRHFFGLSSTGIGAAALASLMGPNAFAAGSDLATGQGAMLNQLHFAPKAKRVIYMFMSGGPSQLDLFDYKPAMQTHHGEELPDSVRMGQRLTGMTSGQDSFPMAKSIFNFQQHGECGHWFSELIPHMASNADDMCVIKSLNTEAINHDPAITYIQTGSQQPGRPSLGAWLSYGLGSANKNLPSFVVLLSRGSSMRDAQPLFERLWGPGFLPSEHQGVKFRAGHDPVLYLSDPPGFKKDMRRRMLDGLGELNRITEANFADPEINTRIEQYEMAYRMQTSVPDLMDISDEPESVLEMYGPDVHKPGSYASNCLLARRLAERGVNFVQLFHRGWDQHFNLPRDIKLQCGDVDQGSGALVKDLKQRGMLDDTLVIWGGEFGRTIYSQGKLTQDDYGRDHHGRCFTMWLAGGGVKPGFSLGETDDFSYNIVKDPVHIHDFNATLLHLIGIDHEKLTFRYQGRDFRLTDVHGNLVKEIMA